MTLALIAAALLSSPFAGESQAGDFAIALFPPEDAATTVNLVKAVGREFSVPVAELGPEDFVDPAQTDPGRYPLAVYSGFERYVFTVKKPGDGAQALLSYVRSGGVLLVAGRCWPFYRAIDYAGGEYVPTRGEPPVFEGPEDEWLREQMAAFDQTATGNFNRFLGLNISGEGTKQLEEPEEEITFSTTPGGRELFPSLSDTFPFPGEGDLRFRPASGANLQPGTEFTPVAIATGASGQVYGPGIAVIGPEMGGTVIYIWGTLLDTRLGRGLVRDAVMLAGRLTATPDELRQARELAGQLKDLTRRATELAQALEGRPSDAALASYLRREVSFAQARLETVRGAATVRRFNAAKEQIQAIEQTLARVNRRLGGT